MNFPSLTYLLRIEKVLEFRTHYCQLNTEFDFSEDNSLPSTAVTSEDGTPALVTHNTISVSSSNTVMLRSKADTSEGLRNLHD